MLSKIYSVELSGLDGHLVEIEVDTRMALPAFSIVGLPDAAITEAKERVMSAVKNTNFPLPRGRIIVNLAPADLRKVGSRYDVPMALGLIAFSDLLPDDCFKDTIFLGELALDGTVRPIAGMLVSTEFARRKGFKRIFLPKENAAEAAIIGGIEIIPIGHLKEAVLHLTDALCALPIQTKMTETEVSVSVDLAMIRGQSQAKRALEIAAAGGHNVLMNGAPGAGKTLMAKALMGILPDMTEEERMEVTRIYSVSGQLPKSQPMMTNRPFRVVHHTASAVSIVGGGSTPMPGEITLAHRGVLFLDEVAEFPQKVLEVLRQPIEEGHITISRAKARITYPSQFSLIAAMNPCPCGYYGVEKYKGRCSCLMWRIDNYHRRLSGPLLDRIDIHLKIEPVEHEALTGLIPGTETSEVVRGRVNAAYQRQVERFKNCPITKNAEMDTAQVEKWCVMEQDGKELLKTAIEHLQFSARGYFRAIKLARTIADLDEQEIILKKHVSEALHYLGRK